MSVAELLTREAGPFEAAAAAGHGGALPVPIAAILDPATTPAAFLPFLAGHESVDLWFSDWSDARKRQAIADGLADAGLKGTRAGAIRFLAYVDATLVDAIAYPARFRFGSALVGRTPIGHPPFVARYLVRLATFAPPRALINARAVIGRARLKTPSREPFRRVLMAARVAKAPETQVRVDFQHARMITIADGIPLDGSYTLGAFVERTKL